MPNKKYYWLKLKKDFFKDRRMKKLRKIAGGPVYTIIYLKLQLLSLDNNGFIEFEGVEDNLVDELELEIDESKEDIQATLFLLEKWGLSEIKEGDLFLPEVIENTGKETASTIRSRKSRLRKKNELLQCNTNATICNTEIELEKEIEKELLLENKKKESLNNDTPKNTEITEVSPCPQNQDTVNQKNSSSSLFDNLLKPYKIHWKIIQSVSNKISIEDAEKIVSYYEKHRASNNWGVGSLSDMLKSGEIWEVKKKDTGKPRKLYTGKQEEEEPQQTIDQELQEYKDKVKELGIKQVPKPMRMAFSGFLRAASTYEAVEKLVMDYNINRTL